MLKRLAILCLLLSFALLQMHNFTPHLHSHGVKAIHNDYVDHQHEHAAHQHDQPADQFAHSEDFGKVVFTPKDGKKHEAKSVHFDLLFLPEFFTLYNREKPPDLPPPVHGSSLHLIFKTHSVPLRAPPAFIA